MLKTAHEFGAFVPSGETGAFLYDDLTHLQE
jgi:hypothetical protein